MGNTNLEEYRRKHKRCRYCKHMGWIGYGDNRVFHWCKAKDRHKMEWLLFPFIENIQGFLCSIYEPREV